MIWPLNRQTADDYRPTGKTGSAPDIQQQLSRIVELLIAAEKRQARIETRLCVLMAHQGLDPAQGHRSGYHPTQAGSPAVR